MVYTLLSTSGKKERGRLKELTERVLVGAEKLARVGLKISTSLIERVNQTFRHALRRWCARAAVSVKSVNQ